MTIILFILALGAIVVAVSLVIMWYLLVFAVTVTIAVIVATFWGTYFLVDNFTNNPETAQLAGVIVAVLVLVGLAYLGLGDERVANKVKRKG